MRKKLLSSAWFVLFMPTVATASLIWDFTISGADLSGSGHIVFSTNSSTTGVVSAFSATGQTFGHAWDVGLPNIATADWQINDTNWNLDQLFLNLPLIPTATQDVFADLQISWVPSSHIANARSLCSDLRPFPLGAGCGGDSQSFASGTVVFAPTHTAVPEPATFLLLAAGMAGLGFTRRKTKKSMGSDSIDFPLS